MFSLVASTIFAVRNAKKTENGEIGRSVVTLGQGAGVMQEITKYDNAIASSAKSAVSVFGDLAKRHKSIEYAGKFAKFASENVNPLIGVSGGIKVAMSDDKLGAGITEATALSAMFTGEHFIKENYDKAVSSKIVKETLTNAKEVKILKPVFGCIEKNKLGGKIGTIVKGVAFVGGSMASYAIGEKLGSDTAKNIEAKIGYKPRKINQMT